VLGGVAFPPAWGSFFFVEDWGVEGAAVGCFEGSEEGDEFAVEPDDAVDTVVSTELPRCL
jgi:hypothetical protein